MVLDQTVRETGFYNERVRALGHKQHVDESVLYHTFSKH